MLANFVLHRCCSTASPPSRCGIAPDDDGEGSSACAIRRISAAADTTARRNGRQLLNAIERRWTFRSEIMTDTQTEVREAVGVFKTAQTLQEAIDELMSSGFDRAELSLLAGEDAVEMELGHQFERVAELEDDPNVPRACYVSNESIGAAQGALIGGLIYVGACLASGAIVVAGGALAGAIAASTLLGGAGGLIGAALAKLVGDRHAQHIQEQLEHGGLLLWVRTWDEADERRAVDILNRHSAFDVHVHSLPAGQALIAQATASAGDRQ